MSDNENWEPGKALFVAENPRGAGAFGGKTSASKARLAEKEGEVIRAFVTEVERLAKIDANGGEGFPSLFIARAMRELMSRYKKKAK